MKHWAYWLLSRYVRTGLWFYFRKMQHAGAENIPKKGPVIFVPNHQNAFLDALVVGAGVNRSLWFLARADVFKRQWAAKLLRFLKIMPVFRFRDGHAAMRKNDKTMQDCVDLLKKGECLLLFPEGNHNEPWTMRALQKGFAQIALMYTEQTGDDIPIIPVGIHFEEHSSYHSAVLVQFGKPLSLKQMIGDLNDRDRFSPILKQTSEQIQELILTVPLDEHYRERRDYLLRNRPILSDLKEQLNADRNLMANWRAGMPDLDQRPDRLPWLRWLNPVYTYGRLTHALPELLMQWIVEKKIRDKQFVGSVKAAVGIFLIPAYYVIVSVAVGIATAHPWWTIGFAVSLPASGILAYRHRK